MRRTDGFLPIEDYGAVGNLRSVALVGTDGSVDWCCFPHLSSPSVFGALLDPERGGHFRVDLVDGLPVEQFYLEDTNVLCTRWHSERGALSVLDFMPVEVLFEWEPRLDTALVTRWGGFVEQASRSTSWMTSCGGCSRFSSPVSSCLAPSAGRGARSPAPFVFFLVRRRPPHLLGYVALREVERHGRRGRELAGALQ